MKLKGVGTFEQYVEKALVGVVAVVLLAVVAMAFLTQPNQISLGRPAKEYPPGEAYTPVEEAARELARKLAAESPKPPDVPELTLVSRLGKGFGADPGLHAVRAPMGPEVRIKGMDTLRPLAAAQYALPSVPAPAAPAVHAFRSTIDPREQIRNAGLAKLLPREQPFDKAAVSIEAKFDGLALRAALEADPDGPGPVEPLPIGWVRDTLNQGNDPVQVLAVEVERETVRRADGSTPDKAEAVIFSGMPGRPGILGEWETQVKSLGDAGALIEQARFLSPEIVSPAYYPTIAGPAWTPPSEVVDVADAEAKGRRIDQLQRDLARVEGRLAQLNEQLRNAPGDDRQRDREPDRGGGGRPGGGGKGGPAGGGGSPPPRDPPQRSTLNRAAIERQIKSFEGQRSRVVAQLGDLGVNVTVDRGASEPEPAGRGEAPTPLLENPEVTLLAHDVTVVPGTVYRYRVRVVVNNPVFGRNVQESQKAIAEPSVLRGPWSEWTALPTEVERDEYVFVTAASPGGQPFQPRPQAVAQLYKFYYGYYREATVSVEPGDQLLGEAKLPDLKLADMGRLAAGAPDQPPAPGVPPPSGPAPSSPGRRGPGQTPVDPERGAPPPPPGAPATPAGPAADWLTVPAPKTLALSADAVFLDTAPVPFALQGPGGVTAGERFQAVLRGVSGALEVQRPDQVRNQELYKRVEASARNGATQGAPAPKPIEPVQPIPGGPTSQPPRPGKGGGGGGGGG